MARIDDLVSLLTAAAKTPCLKVLTCAQDVADSIADVVPDPDSPWHGVAPFAILTGVNVVVTPDSAPGTYQLVRHDKCHVEGATVYHGECLIVETGTLTA